MKNETKSKSKIGILKYIASSGARGIKFEDQPETWYNPANDEAKEMIKDDYKGKQVEIMLCEDKPTEFTSMVLLETKPTKEKVEEIDMSKETKEEKVPQTPPKEEKLDETDAGVPTGPSHVPPTRDPKVIEETTDGHTSINYFVNASKSDQSGYTQAVFQAMQATKVETATKGPHKLTYASWAEVWSKLKEMHPTAEFHVHEQPNGMPVFFQKDIPAMGAFVKVSVTVEGVTHTVHLPVMDHSNRSISLDKMTTFEINKNIQRALAKAIAMHGMGLYVFRGEDLPEDK